MTSLADLKARRLTVDVGDELRKSGNEYVGLKRGDLIIQARALDPETTDEEAARAQAKANTADPDEAERTEWAQRIVDNVAGWDLTAEADDATPIPLTVEAVRAEVPKELMIGILTAINYAKHPNLRNARR